MTREEFENAAAVKLEELSALYSEFFPDNEGFQLMVSIYKDHVSAFNSYWELPAEHRTYFSKFTGKDIIHWEMEGRKGNDDLRDRPGD